MDAHTIQHNAFTGLNTREKTALVRFIKANQRGTDELSIREAIDFAVKNRPSFGGFILTAYRDNETVATLVAHCTGMESCNTAHRLIYAVSRRNDPSAEEAMTLLMQRAVKQTRGQLSLRVEQSSDTLSFFQKLGFKPRYIELQLDQAVRQTIN